jgi:beta propeller repeat protein
MAGRITLIVVCTVVLAGLLAPPVLAVAAAPGEMVLFCTASGSQEHPDIDSGMVVWEDGRDGKYIYRSGSPGSDGLRITDGSAAQAYPSISGDHIAWEDRRDGNSEIYLFSSQGGEKRITNSTTDQLRPVVSRDHIVWYDSRKGEVDICLYDIGTNQETYLECSPVTQWKPALSERYVVWEESTGDGDIWAYEIETGIKRQITGNSARQAYPAISGGRIAWEDYRNGNPDIYLFDLDNPSAGEQRITDDPTGQVSPAIDGELIAWEDKRSGVWNIFICDLALSKEVQMPLYPSSTEQIYPSVSGNTIVWQNGRDGSADIYAFTYADGAPPVAEFSSDRAAGATPLTVRFADRSTGNPESWEWDLGDGGSSAEQNPEYTYESPGEYTVSLTVSNRFGSDTVTKLDHIAVIDPLIASFEADTRNGAAPLIVRFTDTSAGDIRAWSWKFGDGETSSDQNPEHTYTAAGTYTVSLEVENAAGSDTEMKTDYITVVEQPVATFTANPTIGTAPLVVQFMDASTGVPTSWSWKFGDGGISADRNPMHTYERPGRYAVTLAVANSAGENTTIRTGYVTAVEPLVAGFEANATVGSAPLTIQFTDWSTGGPESWQWEFGDGGSSGEQNPTHTYQGAGTYTVRLTAANELDSDTRTMEGYITVTAPPVAGFSANVTEGRAPLAVKFADTSAGGPLSWSWAFGDGGVSADQGPVHVYRAPGTYTVSLTVRNDAGENTTIRTDSITVHESLAAGFTANVTVGAAPLAVQFTDASVGEPRSWSWDFDDNGASTIPDPVHVFEKPGNYTVSLTVVNDRDRSVQSLPIRVFGPPTAGFSAAPLNGTAPLTVAFTDTSTGEPSSWLWSFGDTKTSTDRYPSHTYTAAGNYTVNLTAGNAAGSDTAAKTGYVTVHPAPATPAPTQTSSGGSGSNSGGGGGGGGGGGLTNPAWNTPTPTPTPTASTVSTTAPGTLPGQLTLGETGLVEDLVRIGSPDGVASLAVAEGVRAVDAAGTPLRAVTLDVLDPADMPAVPGGGTYVFAGYACTLGPEGAVFSPSVTLAFSLTKDQWDAVYNGSGQTGLLIQWYNLSADAWEGVPTTVSPETQSVTAEISHFSLYALFVEVSGGSVAQVVADGTQPQPDAVQDLPYAPLVPGLLALILVGAGAFFYFRKEEP